MEEPNESIAKVYIGEKISGSQWSNIFTRNTVKGHSSFNYSFCSVTSSIVAKRPAGNEKSSLLARVINSNDPKGLKLL